MTTTPATSEESIEKRAEGKMPTPLDDYLFDLRGYLILRNAVEPALLDDLNDALTSFPDLELGEWHGNVQRFYTTDKAGIELQNIVEGGKPFEDLIDHPSWISYLRRYCGEEDSYVQGLFIDECFASIRSSGGFFPVHSGGYRGAIRGQYRYKDGVFRCGQVNILLALTEIGPGDGGTMIIPGSHKSNIPHPGTPDYNNNSPMDSLAGAVEVHINKGDAILFVDGAGHGGSSRVNPGERRVTIYRYGVSWGNTRHGYQYSKELLERVTPAQRAILQPIPPRLPPAK
jgi:ectoine hydroxylase-related dioxygenase (phytanoyl-CoA dioxygenase family)